MKCAFNNNKQLSNKCCDSLMANGELLLSLDDVGGGK